MVPRAYNFSTKLYALEQIKSYDEANRLNFNLDCQRGHVWTESQKQGLIDTLMFQERIPEIHVIKDSSSYIFNIIDGKQRLSTVLAFLKNELSWKKKYANFAFQNMFQNKNKLFFYELPVEYQNAILSMEISFATYEIIDESGIVKLFQKLNAGTALNNFQKGIASNIQLRTRFSSKIMNNSNIAKLFSEKLIEKDKVEEIFIDVLVNLLSIDKHDGEMSVVSMDALDVFDSNNSMLQNYLALTDSEKSQWERTLDEKAQIINCYLNIIGKYPIDKPIKSKNQFVFPLLYWYVYNLNEDEAISLFNEIFDMNPARIVGAGSNYNKPNMKKWIRAINSIVFGSNASPT